MFTKTIISLYQLEKAISQEASTSVGLEWKHWLSALQCHAVPVAAKTVKTTSREACA